MEPVTAASAAAAASEEQVTRRVASRIIRALQHQLRLLHRAGPEFFVLGATGNVYTVTLAAAPACTCPDPSVPCKHILFVLLRVLGLSLDEACLWRQSLRPFPGYPGLWPPQVPPRRKFLPGPGAPERFPQAVVAEAPPQRPRRPVAGDNATTRPPQPARRGRLDGRGPAPVCLEEMSPPGAAAAAAMLLTCAMCRNSVHGECFARWKRSRGRRAATCVVCRARWRQPSREQEKEPYINLSAYMNDAGGGDVNMVAADGDDGGLCAG
ncbi:hypothetical protein OsJ_21669 [Oryza sativa Japonica Group]|uniref:SWIM-type domain-containing protein n=1 Tax=Oryza sativa subsp. japonica TaxID=39947 RepID=A3BCP0_ORYSJ|nr:hypothetical protein OsJ_21669 [Oryza sativa Japonica Group]